MYCTSCKAQFPDSYRFCPFCGSKQGDNSAVQNATAQTNQTAASDAENGAVIQNSTTTVNGQNSAATTSDAVASNRQNSKPVYVPAKSAKEKQEDAIWNSFKNQDSAFNAQNPQPAQVMANTSKEAQEAIRYTCVYLMTLTGYQVSPM